MTSKHFCHLRFWLAERNNETMSFSKQFIQEPFNTHAGISLQKSISLGINNNQPALNCNPLYNLSTMLHQPSPCNSSPLARIITRHMVWSCIMVHLHSSHDGCGLFSGVWGRQVQVIRLGCSPGCHLGTAATSAPNSTSSWLQTYYVAEDNLHPCLPASPV